MDNIIGEIMNVRELMEFLSTLDPKLPVTILVEHIADDGDDRFDQWTSYERLQPSMIKVTDDSVIIS
jgi:hypothetical protein